MLGNQQPTNPSDTLTPLFPIDQSQNEDLNNSIPNQCNQSSVSSVKTLFNDIIKDLKSNDNSIDLSRVLPINDNYFNSIDYYQDISGEREEEGLNENINESLYEPEEYNSEDLGMDLNVDINDYYNPNKVCNVEIKENNDDLQSVIINKENDIQNDKEGKEGKEVKEGKPKNKIFSLTKERKKPKFFTEVYHSIKDNITFFEKKYKFKIDFSGKYKINFCEKPDESPCYIKKKKEAKEKKPRKLKPDDIRKKIKSRFHKALYNLINKKIKEAGSPLCLEPLAQDFITNISVKFNKFILKQKIIDILRTDYMALFNELYGGDKDKTIISKYNKNNYNKNEQVIQSIMNNPRLSLDSGITFLSVYSYKEVFTEYLNSQEFRDSALQLEENNETREYICHYLNKAYNYVKFFSDE